MNVLPIEEIEKQYHNQWVLLDELVQEPNLKVKAGHVVFASPDRQEVHEQAMKLMPKRSAFLFMGPLTDDDNMIYVL